MVALRLISPQFDITFGAMLDIVAWTDVVSTFVVYTGFNVVLTFFVVSAYLDRLCEHLFVTRGVNLGVFHGRFRRKVGFALIFVSFAAMILLVGDIASYGGPRLIREATVDVVSSLTGGVIIVLLDHPGADPADGPPRSRHAPGRRERPRGAPAGDVGRRDGPRRQPLQRDGRGPVGARVPARHVRQVCERERRHRDPARRAAHRPCGRHDRRGDADVHRHRGLHRPFGAPGAGRGRQDPQRLSRHRRAGDPEVTAASSTASSATACSPASTCRCRSRIMPPPPSRPHSRSSRPWPVQPFLRTSTCARASASTRAR